MVRNNSQIKTFAKKSPLIFFKAFVYAGRGIKYFFTYDRNGRIYLVAGTATIMAGFVFKVSGIEWLILLLCIALVIVCEMINAAIEKLCDVVHKEFHPAIKIIKDISAGAVLFVSVISAAAGLIIFIPKIISCL